MANTTISSDTSIQKYIDEFLVFHTLEQINPTYYEDYITGLNFNYNDYTILMSADTKLNTNIQAIDEIFNISVNPNKQFISPDGAMYIKNLFSHNISRSDFELIQFKKNRLNSIIFKILF